MQHNVGFVLLCAATCMQALCSSSMQAFFYAAYCKLRAANIHADSMLMLCAAACMQAGDVLLLPYAGSAATFFLQYAFM